MFRSIQRGRSEREQEKESAEVLVRASVDRELCAPEAPGSYWLVGPRPFFRTCALSLGIDNRDPSAHPPATYALGDSVFEKSEHSWRSPTAALSLLPPSLGVAGLGATPGRLSETIFVLRKELLYLKEMRGAGEEWNEP